MKEGKKVLEFVAIYRKDNELWSIPGVGVLLQKYIEYKKPSLVFLFGLRKSKPRDLIFSSEQGLPNP